MSKSHGSGLSVGCPYWDHLEPPRCWSIIRISYFFQYMLYKMTYTTLFRLNINLHLQKRHEIFLLCCGDSFHSFRDIFLASTIFLFFSGDTFTSNWSSILDLVCPLLSYLTRFFLFTVPSISFQEFLCFVFWVIFLISFMHLAFLYRFFQLEKMAPFFWFSFARISSVKSFQTHRNRVPY